MATGKRDWKVISWNVVLTVLCIACFPANPLVLSGVLEVDGHLVSTVAGGIFWAIGMVLVAAPVVMFPRHGGVPKGRSFVETTRLVDKGIYSLVRHPQYLGGILSIFVATPLLYPHWLLGLLGVAGIVVVYISCGEEERRLVLRFGDEYIEYMERVPRVNIVAGLVRRFRQKALSDCSK